MKVVHKGPQVVHFAPLLFTSHRSLHTQPRSHFVIRASAALPPTAAPGGQPKKEKPNLLTALVSISAVPYSSYVPEPQSFLHTLSAEIKQIWTIGVLLLLSRASLPMRLALVALVALITIAGLPPRLWRPQLMRVGGLCAVIFLFSALGSDGAAPLVADRSPPPMPGNLPPSMADLATNKYSYTVLNLGIFSVTKRSLSLAVTLAGLTFVALQSASLCLVTTPPERMAVAVGRFLRPLGLIRVPVKELVLTVLLALRFMATVFEEARNLCLGLASRGIDWSLVGTRGALALGLRTCIKLFRNLLARSESIAVAMAARGFRGPEEHRLFVESNRAGSVVSDALAVASLAGLIGLSTVFT